MDTLIVYACLVSSVGLGYIWPSTCNMNWYQPYRITIQPYVIFEEFNLITTKGEQCTIDDIDDTCTFTMLPYNPVIIQNGAGILKVEMRTIQIKNLYLPVIYDN